MADFKSIVANMFRKNRKKQEDKIVSKVRGYKPYTNEEIAKLQAISRLPAQMQQEAYKSDKALASRVAELTPKALEARPFVAGAMNVTGQNIIKKLETATGKPLDTAEVEKSALWKAGSLAGEVANFALTGGAAGGAVAGLVTKGAKLGKLAQLGANVTGDVIAATPYNLTQAASVALDSKNPEKEFAKQFAINTALDVGIGGAIGVVPIIAKALKKVPETKVVGDALEKGGAIKDAQIAEAKVQQAVKNLTQRKLKPSTTITQPLPESQMINTQPIQPEVSKAISTLQAKNKPLQSIIKQIKSSYNSKINTQELSADITKLHTLLNSGNADDLDIAAEEVYNMAKKVVANSSDSLNPAFVDYNALKSYMKKTPLKVLDEHRGDFGKGEWNRFRKSNFGKLNLSNDGQTMDSIYMELVELFPSLLSKEMLGAAPSDQLKYVIDVMDSLKNSSKTIDINSSDGAELVDMVAMDILNSVGSVKVTQPSTTTLPTQPVPSTEVPKASKRKAKEYPVIDEIANMQYRSKKQMNNIHSKFVKPEKETVARSLGGDIKSIQRSLFNSFAPIENRFRKLADKDLMNRGLNAVEGVRKTEAQIQHMIQKGMLDNSGINVVGDSLSSVKQQIEKIVDYDLWNIYYAHLENIYRPKGQAVFPRVTAKESQSIVNKIELDHPEILDARDIALNWRNQMDAYDVASGNMSLAEKEAYREQNPFYFPIARVQGTSTKTPYSKKTAELFKVYKTKGGQKDIQPWHVAQENWIRASVSSSKMNDLGNVMEEVLGKSKKGDEVFSPETYSMGSSVVEEGDKKFLRYLKDGKQVKAEITPEEYVGLKDFFNPKTKNKWAKRLGTQSRLFKDLTVNWNPIFPLINGPRDFFDAVLNSKDAVKMLTSYPKAFVAAVNPKNPYNKLYHQAGVQRSQFVDRDLMDSKNPWIKNTIGRIEQFNSFVEMLPRMAEFVATIDKSIGGKVTPDKLMDRISKDLLQTAGRNAAEVTLNFDKSGLVGKYMNETLFPFFNPALQGFAKTINLFTSPAVEKTYKDYARLLPKLALWGILPAAFNEIVYKDNEAYQKLNSRDKNLNYIFMLPNGYAVKIPKGRIQAAISIPARETIDPDKTTPLEVAKSIYGSVGVPNPTSSNIIFPAWGAFVSGKNWMGYDIESQKDAGNAIQERWDSSTSEIGKLLGKVTGDIGLSPKDIDYLIDSYTGFLGDVILPLTTKGYRQGKGDVEDILGRRFLINPTYQNELASKFYNYMDEAEKIGNDNEATDKDKMYFKFLSRYNDELTDLRKQIEEVQLGNAPNKKELLDDLQTQLNATYDTAINGYENFELFLQDSGIDIAFEQAVAQNAGGTYKDYAEFFNESKMDYQEAEKAGIPVETYYKAFSEMSTDGNSNISQAEAQAYLDSTDLTTEQKAIMWKQVNSGWKTNPYTGGTVSTGTRSSGGSKTSAVAKAYRDGLATKQVQSLKNINIDSPNITKAELKAIIKMLSA